MKNTTNMTKKARGFEKQSAPGCAPTLGTLRRTQRYVILVLRVIVHGGSSSGGRECRGWSGGGWSSGSGTPAAAAAAPRKAALDACFVVHLAQEKVVGGIAPAHLLFCKRAWTEGRVAASAVLIGAEGL